MLLIAAIFSGLCFGIPPAELVVLITTGFGQTLSSIGIVIVLGAVIGVFLEKSNGITHIVSSVLKVFGNKNSGLALNVTGFITAIPVFCDAAFVILSAIPKALSKRTGFHVIFYGVSLGNRSICSPCFYSPHAWSTGCCGYFERSFVRVVEIWFFSGYTGIFRRVCFCFFF